MTTLEVSADHLMSTSDFDLQFVDIIGRAWQEHPEWKPGDPWEDRWVYPEDEGYQTLGWQIIEWAHTYLGSPGGPGRHPRHP